MRIRLLPFSGTSLRTCLYLAAPVLVVYCVHQLNNWLSPGTLHVLSLKFLSLFIEATPFLLIGSIVSGIIETYVSPEVLMRFVPKNSLARVLVGSCLGMVFPVCECGVVPVVRRLLRKGMPSGMAIAFLLGAPTLNPIVLLSTIKAFGIGSILFWRMAGTVVVASLVGILVSGKVLPVPRVNGHVHQVPARSIRDALAHAADDFLGIGGYLVLGAILATCTQAFVTQSMIASIGMHPVLSVPAMEVLAFVLSICSTIDAFIAVGFTGTFSGGAIVAFLVYGPMVDIKSTLMFLNIFPRKTVLSLVLFPLLLTTVLGTLLNTLHLLR